MEPVPRPFSRTLRTFRSAARFYFIRSDAAVAVPVEPQDERAWLLDKLLARDLAILVFVKITEIGVGQCGVRLAYRCELRRIEMPVAVAIRQRKYAVKKALPFVTSVDAAAIGAPGRRPREQGVLCWPRGGLGESTRSAGQNQRRSNGNPANRSSIRQIFLLSLQSTAAGKRTRELHEH